MERETLVEVTVSVAAVGLFVAAFVGVGAVYPDLDNGGALALVGSIVFFVVLMAVAGYWLADSEPEL